MSVVHLFQNRFLHALWCLLSIWSNCLAFTDFIVVRVSHIFCEGNMVADDLSKMVVYAYEEQ